MGIIAKKNLDFHYFDSETVILLNFRFKTVYARKKPKKKKFQQNHK